MNNTVSVKIVPRSESPAPPVDIRNTARAHYFVGRPIGGQVSDLNSRESSLFFWTGATLIVFNQSNGTHGYSGAALESVRFHDYMPATDVKIEAVIQ